MPFPPPGLQVQPDDRSDALLMLICGSLAAVENRALCPKEIAELCSRRGWSCRYVIV